MCSCFSALINFETTLCIFFYSFSIDLFLFLLFWFCLKIQSSWWLCFRRRILDVSFNRVLVIENLSHQTKLKKLFLVNNRIQKIENISHMVNLDMLELGSNRIRASHLCRYCSQFIQFHWVEGEICLGYSYCMFSHNYLLTLQKDYLHEMPHL